MTWFYENPLTIFLAIISFIIVIVAQIKVSGAYSKYKKKNLNKTISGMEAAKMILDANGLDNIYIVETKGNLTDHYDPSRKVIRLSKEVFNGEDIAAVAIAAHECGHAIQDKEGYFMMKIRSFLVPVVNLITYIGYIGLIISIFAGITGYIKVSIFLLLATLLFQLVTLPVEFDASKRANTLLVNLGIIDSSEVDGTKKVLSAAAFTYVASLISTLLNILRLVIMLRSDD